MRTVHRDAPDRAGRGAGVRVCRQARPRRPVCPAGRRGKRRAAPPGGGRSQEPVQPRFLDRVPGLLRHGARIGQAASRGGVLESGSRPLVRHRGSGQGRPAGRPPHGPGHVQRLGHPDALGSEPRLYPDRVSPRDRLAPRQRARRRGLQALRLRRATLAGSTTESRPRRWTSSTTACPSSSPAFHGRAMARRSATPSRATRRPGRRARCRFC